MMKRAIPHRHRDDESKVVEVFDELDLHVELRRAIEHGAGAAVLAEESGFKQSMVYGVFDGTRLMNDRIADALGYERFTGWRRKEFGGNGRVYDASQKPRRGRPPKPKDDSEASAPNAGRTHT